VVLANADERRLLGEKATASRILPAAIAAGAVAFNWLAHADHLLGGFFARMSALGLPGVWLMMHTENQRRDRLRAKSDLAWTTPAYELVGRWLRHPCLTRLVQAMSKATQALGLYVPLVAARASGGYTVIDPIAARPLWQPPTTRRLGAKARVGIASAVLLAVGAMVVGAVLAVRWIANSPAELVLSIATVASLRWLVRKRGEQG
jgi:hypothetical protein